MLAPMSGAAPERLSVFTGNSITKVNVRVLVFADQEIVGIGTGPYGK